MIARAPEPEVVEIPESTPQPSVEIIYIPYPVEVLVPYPVEKTTNVCPVEERKKPARRAVTKPAQVCK